MYKDALGLAKQPVFGTKVTAMEYFPGVESAARGINQGQLEQAETTGTRFPTGIELGEQYFAPTARGPVRLASIPRILSSFFGAPVTTTPDNVNAPTGRQHAFESGVPLQHSILMANEDPSPSIVDLLYDALGNNLGLSVQAGGFLMWDASWIGASLDTAQPDPVVTRDQTKRLSYAKVKCYLSVNGGAETEVKVGGWSLDYSNGISPDDFILGQNGLFSVAEGNASATVKFSPRQTLSAHVRRALLQDPDSVKIRLAAVGALLGGTIFNKVEVIANACEYIDVPVGISAADRLKMVDVTARVKIDDTTGKFVSTNVVNVVAAY